ncbi:hypothetical protein [Piscinibacter sp.]|jgi:hypothetical protein|uniref:hypothetical protein n=1 Tax=Piscinibacter sp. TaxID=1903157 RepID=UPI002F42A873
MVTKAFVTPITFLAMAFPGPQTAQAAQVQVGKAALALPFDTMRARYACAVEHGLIERSMLASGKFERAVGAPEQLAVGCWRAASEVCNRLHTSLNPTGPASCC